VVLIRFLADVPEHVDQLADWHHAQWHQLYTDWTRDSARAELLAHTQCRTLPTTLVLMENDMLLGSVSLLEDDAIELSAIGNAWLASLYVKPSERGRGFGAQLVNALMQHAKNISLKEIFLFTPEHKAFYQTLGWMLLQQANVNNQQVDVMSYQIHGIAQ
jgi:GNAT superfamily N-acetyltransferase